MFEPSATPRVFGLAPGVDFPRAVVAGLKSRLAGQPPETMARVEVYANSARMRRRLREVFAESGALLLPRLRLITDFGADVAADLPVPVPPLRRRLELTRLVAHLLDREPDLAPRAALYDLADSLAALMDEMQGEGVSPEAFRRLDLSDHSRHWERSLKFLSIVAQFFGPGAEPDAEARQRQVVERLAERWATSPPDHPVIVAGSTGSRGTTALFLQAVARLPQGAVILPGFDPDMPGAVWHSLGDALTGEDHPQFRLGRLLNALGLDPVRLPMWTDLPPPSPARNRLISLSLRPAPVTDQWMIEGQDLPPLPDATEGVALIEAPTPRAEALAIALCLRHAAETGRRAALVTPDRQLGRQVTAALDRWGIRPDDSAGQPLSLSPPGRFLRHVAALNGRRLSLDALLTLLKHPLTNTGAEDRGNHLRWTRGLEMRLRRHGPAFPTGADLIAWAEKTGGEGLADWAAWLADTLAGAEEIGTRALADHVAGHIARAEALARGPGGTGTGELWRREAGEAALAATAELTHEAVHGGDLGAFDYEALFTAILQRCEVRGPEKVHPTIMIRGALEARVHEADLVILGGLNDGIWPALPTPDPWLNRQMRHDLSLLLPERQIGLSAHDYQQAVAAPEVVLSRSMRDDEAETVPSRWLNRLMNLMAGLPDRAGPEALAAMQARGAVWVRMAEALDRPPAPVTPARRPSPRPPVAARPRQLPVTGIQTLIRDPYAVYARHVLRLRPLDPLHPAPDARLRGSVLHRILERFVQERGPEDTAAARARLLGIADEVMTEAIAWTTAQRLWRARLERAADFFLTAEAARQGRPVLLETDGAVVLPALGFTLTAQPDRIDALDDGRIHILDYKTGALPSPKQQEVFDKQLLLEAAMAERGGFAKLGPREVAAVTYVGLGSTPKEARIAITAEITGKVWEELGQLLARYAAPAQGYTARRAVVSERIAGDYDHLARFGEWEMSDASEPEDVG
ncbi:MAG: double-strand break repair protein AddB [Rhodobacteraceae bacterium]|nr:double-strand break repair protein AddB [Paracoccaceae bacterium]